MTWDDIYYLYEKICIKKHTSLLKNTTKKQVIVPLRGNRHIDTYDFVPSNLYNKAKKDIVSETNKITKCLFCNKNIKNWIIALTLAGKNKKIYTAICLYASVIDFERRNISCDFSLNKIKKEIKIF